MTEQISNSQGIVYQLDGIAGTLVVYKTKLTITPKGVLGFLTKGLKGTKTILFGSITGIQVKDAGLFLSGYIQFTIPGGNESKSGIFDATHDENTIMFKGENNNALVAKIKDYIEEEIQRQKSPQVIHSTPASIADELQKLAQLKSQGVLTEEEFEIQKKKLLA